MTKPKIHVGVVAFNVVPSFEDTLKKIKPHVDSIAVVYGRFKGFEHEWIEPPNWLSELSTSFIESDHKLIQHNQRDLYLEGVDTGDILFIMDCDWIPVFSAGAFPRFRNMNEYGSAAFNLFEPQGLQFIVRTFWWQDGWKHSPGQIPIDQEGHMVCGPYYKVLHVDLSHFFYLHDSRKYFDPVYDKAYNQYWKNLNTASIQYPSGELS